MKVRPNLRVILVGGSSHVGKSTLSGSLAAELGWTHVSSDTLARHPGRPWKPEPEKVPDNVAEHYISLSVDELLRDVLCHYRVNVWPKVEAIVAAYSNDTSRAGVIVEGSALWPEFATSLNSHRTAALWLTNSSVPSAQAGLSAAAHAIIVTTASPRQTSIASRIRLAPRRRVGLARVRGPANPRRPGC